jgi:hypothetical protein
VWDPVVRVTEKWADSWLIVAVQKTMSRWQHGGREAMVFCEVETDHGPRRGEEVSHSDGGTPLYLVSAKCCVGIMSFI